MRPRYRSTTFQNRALKTQLFHAYPPPAEPKVQKLGLACPPDTPCYAELCTRWRRVHRLFSNFVDPIPIGTTPGGRPVREALDYLRGIKTWTGAKMRVS